MTSDETRVLDAAMGCVERFGFSKVTIDDITAASGVSRATIYRLFPGGREVLFEAMRLRELENFFSRLQSAASGSSNIEELLVRCIVFCNLINSSCISLPTSRSTAFRALSTSLHSSSFHSLKSLFRPTPRFKLSTFSFDLLFRTSLHRARKLISRMKTASTRSSNLLVFLII